MASVRLARKLSERGHRVSFLVQPGSMTSLALSGSHVVEVPVQLKGYVHPIETRQLRRWIMQNPVDLIHCHYAKDLWTLVPALGRRHASVPLVLTKHIGTQNPKKDILHRWIYSRVHFIIAISEVIRKNVLRTHPVSENAVGTIPNGVETGPFDSARRRRPSVRQTLGFPENAMVVGIAGRLSWWKGYREYLLAAERLLQKRDDLWFLAVGGATVGEEQEAEAVRDFARSLQLKDRVVFAGFRNDMADLYSAMDLFVYPAYAEAFGLVLIEAMAAGLAVISTNCDGVPEIVQDGKTGLLVPARDVESLVHAVERLLMHPDERKAFGSAGRKRVEILYDFERVVSQTEQLYERLIANRTVQ
jgi:glycosyltransferase involved in cell wall biosynthesis